MEKIYNDYKSILKTVNNNGLFLEYIKYISIQLKNNKENKLYHIIYNCEKMNEYIKENKQL